MGGNEEQKCFVTRSLGSPATILQATVHIKARQHGHQVNVLAVCPVELTRKEHDAVPIINVQVKPNYQQANCLGPVNLDLCCIAVAWPAHFRQVTNRIVA